VETVTSADPASSFGRRAARHTLVFTAFVVLTVAMTWPWAAHLRDACSDPGDPYLNSWILWWDFHQTSHDPLHLFQGNIFYPYQYSLAFSEHNYGLALPLFPLFVLGLRPLTAQSLLTLLGFAFSGFGAFRLARTLMGSTGAAWVAGIGFAFVPYRFQHLSHVNYLFAAWIPLTLEAVVLYIRKPDWRRAAWLGAAVLLSGLSVIHWFVLSLVPLLLTGLYLAPRYGRGRLREVAPKGLMTLAAAGVLLLPFFIPYARVSKMYGMVRSEDEVLAFSAKPYHWLTSDPRSQLWHGLGENPPPGELSIFPGLLLILLPVAALLVVRKGERSSENVASAVPPTSGPPRPGLLLALDLLSVAVATVALFASNIEPLRLKLAGHELLKASSPARALALLTFLLFLRWSLAWPRAFFWVRHPNLHESLRHGRRGEVIGVGLICFVTGFLGSFGLRFSFHRALFELIPLFRSIRVPARWAMVADLGLALLAGAGALALAESWKRRRDGSRVAGGVVFGAAAVALLLEQRVAPLGLFRGKADPDGLTQKIATLPMRGGLLELPSSHKNHGNYEYVLRAADHGKPLVNGVSGFGLPIVQRIDELTREKPIPDELLDLIESIPVSYVTVRESWLTPPERVAFRDFLRRAADAGRLRYLGRFDAEARGDLWAVSKTEPSSISEAPLPWRLTRRPGLAAAWLKGLRLDNALTGGLNPLPENGVVRGALVVRGWARTPGEDLEVRILIDGEERGAGSVKRYSRPDVSVSLPKMGYCTTAGFEARFEPTEDDEGRHEITAIFVSRDGRYRIYPPAAFTWKP
jgi:hypothetical protein